MTLIPAAPIRQVVEDWCKRNPDLRKLEGAKSKRMGQNQILCNLAGIRPDFLYELMNGEKQQISFDTADRIVIALHRLGALGWWWEDDLRAIYEGYDFATLDQKSPCFRVAA